MRLRHIYRMKSMSITESVYTCVYMSSMCKGCICGAKTLQYIKHANLQAVTHVHMARICSDPRAYDAFMLQSIDYILRCGKSMYMYTYVVVEVHSMYIHIYTHWGMAPSLRKVIALMMQTYLHIYKEN